MKLDHEFTVTASKAEAFRLLTDIEAVAPCLPGAEVTGVEDDHYKGRVKVKLGPIAAQYRGTLRIVEQDEAAGRVVLQAEGRDSGGGGMAKATITAALVEAPGGTRVSADTDLTISGRVAQMGRGLLAEVSGRLMDEFAANLERQLGSAPPPADTEPAQAGAQTAAPLSTPPVEVEPVDLLAAAGAPLARRLVPLVVGLVVVAAALYWLVG